MRNYSKLAHFSRLRLEYAQQFAVERPFLSELEPVGRLATVVRGARGVGKTVGLLQFLNRKTKEGEKVLYVSADQVLLDGTLIELAESFHDRGGGYLVVDEVHRYENWTQETKNILDTWDKIKLLVSGSSSLQIDHGKADLSRRHRMIQVRPVDFREYLNLAHGTSVRSTSLEEVCEEHEQLALEVSGHLVNQEISVLDEFRNYLKFGQFPTFLDIGDPIIYQETLRSAIDATIDVDLPSAHPTLNGRSRDRIKRLLRLISNLCPFVPNIADLKQQLDITDSTTLKNYLAYLDESEILTNIYSKNRGPSDLLKPEKIFLSNTNYVHALSDSPNLGAVRETFVAQSLRGRHQILLPAKGDFLIDGEITLEVGGKSKTTRQIRGISKSYVVIDDDKLGSPGRIPLYLLGLISEH